MSQLKTTGSEFVLGLKLLGKGFGRFGRSPKLLLLGAIPAVITGVLFVAAWAFLLIYLGDLSAWATSFADDWPGWARGAIEFGAGAAILVAAVLLSVLTFTALTLLIGDPFYETISERIEDGLGGTPGAVDRPWYRTLGPSLVDSLRLVTLGVVLAVPLFLMGFIPVVGQTVVPVLNALVGGWLIALELTGIPFNRRGMRLAERRKVLRANRALTLGFGIPVFLLLLIPVAAIIVIPAAVSGATLLTRRTLGLPIDDRGRAPAPPAASPHR